MKSPILLVTLLVAALFASAPARTIQVPGDYPTLQIAVTAALPGDVVSLGRGRHQDVFMQLQDGITIRGDLENPEQVIVDAGQAGYVFLAESVNNIRIEGLTITGGHANGSSSYSASGGGIFVSRSNVTLERVIFQSNRAESSGGGVRAAYSELAIIDCEFRGCTAAKGGGAIDLSYDSDATVTGTTFEGNRAAWGGAVSARTGSSCIFDDCQFLGNSALPPQNLGGAFFADHAARVTFRYCVMADNSARQGGAARLTGALVGLSNCTIDGNSASEVGGAFMVRSGSMVLQNCIVSHNQGEAVNLVDDASIWVVATDIYGNTGGDWTGDLAALLRQYDNFTADPLFCDLGIYTLQESSPCAEANSDVGLVGALPVGCVDVGLALQELTAEVRAGEVVIGWSVSGLDDHQFRLTGRSRDDTDEPAWSVPFEDGDAAGSYRAVDKPARALYPVIYKLDVRSGDGPWVALGEREVRVSSDFGENPTIHAVFPNPFNPQVTIAFSLPEESRVRAEVYDLLGRRVRTLADAVLPVGQHEVFWDSRDEAGRPKATGTYILRISTEQGPVLTRKLLLIK